MDQRCDGRLERGLFSMVDMSLMEWGEPQTIARAAFDVGDNPQLIQSGGWVLLNR